MGFCFKGTVRGCYMGRLKGLFKGSYQDFLGVCLGVLVFTVSGASSYGHIYPKAPQYFLFGAHI